MNSLPTGTVTFLFTDMESSTKLWEQHPDRMPLALARHDLLLQNAIEASGGRVFKTVGDAFCAAFATPHNALQAALSAQTALAAEAWSPPLMVRVRMALHTGAAEERGGDYFGPPLNRVARLMSAGHGGQILLSEAAHALLTGALPPDVSVKDMGRHTLKDLSRAEQVFQACHPALPADFPPLRTLDNPALPNNLPQQATSFVGRQQEAFQVKALLAQTRLLTLTGTGGSGKTRLSLQVAADLLSGDGDGVWLVELAPLSDPSLVAREVARTLNIAEQAGRTILDTLTDALKDKCLLLVLDNCEHMVAACAALANALLRACPDVHILASSRERLGVPGEQTYPVPPLSVPDSATVQTADALAGHEAVRLFAERAQSAQPSWMLTDRNAVAVAQVCRRLDGIPLALELAAARVRAMPVEQINARLDNRFRLLTGGSRTALPRQQTLRALIDWSYDLLGESEKALLRSLSVFAGGWTLEAAEAVGAGEALAEWEVLDTLTMLVDKSLVIYDEQGDIARYRLLENIRQYGQERLAESGEEEERARQHSAWCLALAQQAEPHLAGPEQAAWLNRLEAEHDNLRAALLWYQGASDGAQTGLRLCGALWRLWSVHGHFTEGRQWLGRALERTQSLDASAPRMAALLGAGSLANAQCDQESARAFFGEMLDRARAAGDNKNVAEALDGLFGTAYDQDDYATARVLREQCLDIQRQIGDQAGIATSLGSLGNLAYQRGEHEAARAFIEEAIALQRQLGNLRGVAGWVNNLGIITATQGDFETARTLYLEALEIRRALGDLLGIARTLNSLGVLAGDQEDWGTARSFYEESLVLCRQIGNIWSTATALGNLGLTAESQGDFDTARVLQEESLALNRQIGNLSGMAVTLNPLGRLAARRGDAAEAVRCFREELELARRMESLFDIAKALRGMAFLAVQQEHWAKAVRLESAATAAQEQHGGAVPVPNRVNQEKVLAEARAILGDSAFEGAWAAGQSITWEEAAEEGLAS